MPKASKNRNRASHRGVHSQPYTMENNHAAQEQKRIGSGSNAESPPREGLSFLSLIRCFEDGTLNPAEPITESHLDGIGGFKTMKKYKKKEIGGYKLNGSGRELFHHVIHITVSNASATAINRIRELGGSIKTKVPWDESSKNNKFMRLSKKDREDPKNIEEASKRIEATWNQQASSAMKDGEH